MVYLPSRKPIMGSRHISQFIFDAANKNAHITLSGDARTASVSASAVDYPFHGTQAKAANDWYYEVAVDVRVDTSITIGLGAPASSLADAQYAGSVAGSWGYAAGGNVLNNGAPITAYATYAAGDVIGVAYKATAGKLWFSKNGVWQSGDPNTNTGGITSVASGAVPIFSLGSTNQISIKPLKYSIPNNFGLW